MEAARLLDDIILQAECAVSELPADGGQEVEKIQWLKRHCEHYISQLRGYLADLDAGLSVVDIGFGSGEEFEEMLADLVIEIDNLKGLIQSLQMISR